MAPSSTTPTSVLVPPMSKLMMLSSFSDSA